MKRLLIIGLATIALASTGNALPDDNMLCDSDIHSVLTEEDIDDIKIGVYKLEELLECSVRDILDGNLGENVSPAVKAALKSTIDEFRDGILMMEALSGRSIEELLGRE